MAGSHDRARLAHAAHDGAQVRCLHDHAHAPRLEALHQEVGDLLGHPLLDLQAARVHLDDPRDLRQPDHPAPRDVGHGGRPEERQQVVLAQGVERDVLDDDHLAVVDIEDRAVDQPLRVDVVAGGQLGVHPVNRPGVPASPCRSGSSPISTQDLAHGASTVWVGDKAHWMRPPLPAMRSAQACDGHAPASRGALPGPDPRRSPSGSGARPPSRADRHPWTSRRPNPRRTARTHPRQLRSRSRRRGA